MTNPQSGGSAHQGSLARGVSGNYEFQIREVLSEAWAKTDGFKLIFLISYVLYTGVLAGVGVGVGLVTAIFDRVGLDFVDLLGQIIPILIGMPMVAGISVLGLRRSAGVVTSPLIVFNYFSLWIPIMTLTLLIYIMVAIGLVLFVIPGLYLAFSYVFALLLMVDKKLSPWEAMEASRKAVSSHWIQVAGLMLLLALINAATLFTLGIALFWTIPLTYIAIGVLYQKIFGVEAETLSV